MSLDQNLFTLSVAQDQNKPHIINLVDPAGTPHYTKHRIAGHEYKIEVYDPLSQSLLITASAPSATSKTKVLQLHNPSAAVELKYTGRISFRWGFKWEEHEFEWKREECFMIRKPDPPVLVALTREPAGRIKTTVVQILDYNLNRFDIEDRKGLEIVMLTALLTFQDLNDTYHGESANGTAGTLSNQGAATNETSQKPPPKPAPKIAQKTGIDRIAEMQSNRGAVNEVTVADEGDASDYAKYCSKLLKDDAMLFITIKSATAEQVPKVLRVVDEAKRIRHKAGISEDETLHQYVLYDTDKPKRIVLDGEDKLKNKYAPPKSLTVHLSKIDMPELRPESGKSKDRSSKLKKKEEPKPSKSSAEDTSASKKLRRASSTPFKPGSSTADASSSVQRARLKAQPSMVFPSPRIPKLSTSAISSAPPPKQPSPLTDKRKSSSVPGLLDSFFKR